MDGNHGQQQEPQMNADRRGYERQGRVSRASTQHIELAVNLCHSCNSRQPTAGKRGPTWPYAVLRNEPSFVPPLGRDYGGQTPNGSPATRMAGKSRLSALRYGKVLIRALCSLWLCGVVLYCETNPDW